jgi:dipeptidyl aminopeptidase/acylaminoacyl peptidase
MKVSIGLLLLGTATLASAAEPRAMTPVDLLEVASLSDAQLAPDGDSLVFVRTQADWKANKPIRHVWRVAADGSGLLQLTNGPDGESSPRWSPDGTTLAFVAKRGDDTFDQIYLLSTEGGEARRLTRHASAVDAIQWSPDGRQLYFLAPEPKSAEQKKREKAKDDVVAFDEDYKQVHLWRVGVADGREERLSEGDFSLRSYGLSRDGSRVVCHRAPTPRYDDWDESEVWVTDADFRGGVQLTHNAVPENGAALSPDNQWVLFLSDSNERFETYYNDNLFVVPAGGGAARLLLPELPHEVRDAAWSKDGRSIYFLANTGVRVELFAVEVASGALRQLTRGDHTTSDWSYAAAADRHVFTLETPDSPGDVWTLPGPGGAEPARVTRIFDDLAARFALPRQEAIRWQGADGATVEGLLFYPLGYETGRRYPLVVQTHGGPASSDTFVFGSWGDYVQVLTAMGYAVLQPNYRGSTGYGDAFLRDMVGGYFRQAHLDVMAGVDHLIAHGIADGERLVKMGWSAGGHMTNKLITFSDRFKAASSGAGAVNWISMYGQSDVRHYRTPWFGGTPWQRDAPIDSYWRNSPLSEIAKVKTPTLILVGEKDVRVPPPQSIELYRALRANGVPARLYIAPREPHGWRELRHRLFKINVELEWFERYARGREYTWAQAPATEEPPEEEQEEAPGGADLANGWPRPTSVETGGQPMSAEPTRPSSHGTIRSRPDRVGDK